MPNEEPSVLDYLKSRLKFWKSSAKVELPPEPIPQAPEKPEAGASQAHELEAEPAPAVRERGPEPEPPQAAALPSRPWPWRSLLALALALAGERLFEPPGKASAGLYLYLLSAAFLGWAILRKEWTLADFPAAEEHEEPFTIRRVSFLLSLPLPSASPRPWNKDMSP